MEIALLIFAVILLIAGVIGSIIPILPGPILAWVSLLLLYFSGYGQLNVVTLVITGIIMLASLAVDYIVPAWGTKKFGGTKAGSRGANIGILAGIFLGPFGIILGPFAGAFIGELIHDSSNYSKALKSAWGSFIGFLTGSGIKLIITIIYAWIFIKAAYFY